MNFLLYKTFVLKALRRLSIESNSLYFFISPKFVINQKIKKHARMVDKEQFAKLLKQMLGDFETLGFSNVEDRIKNNIISWANETIDHKFDYLGSGLVKLDPIDWHSDFKTGFNWPQGKFYRNYIQVDLSNNSDVKVPRELSRCHHLLWLGQAYLFTKEEKYAKEIVFQIENWIDKNPLMYSINWCCSMDIAIRAINWIYAINMILSSIYATDQFIRKLYRSLFEHGFFIFNNLEKGIPYSNNHYASNLAGLLFISRLFLNTRYGKKWWNFSLPEFYNEIREQILPSGVHFEKSTSYHRLMTELFAYPFLMMKRIGEYVPMDIEYRIKSMFDFVYHYIKPNGFAPMISDNDDGRFLPFYKYDLRDHRYLLSLASLMYNDPEYKYHINKCVIDNYFLYGKDSHNTHTQISTHTNRPFSSCYQDAGFVILRTDDVYAFICNGGLCKYNVPTVQSEGTHTHADLLSFELTIGENDLFVDAGAYLYTANAKANIEFRSTKKHNTIVFDDKDQYELTEQSVFLGRKFPVPEILFFHHQEKTQTCNGKYSMSLGEGVILDHQRSFILHDNAPIMEIEDTVNAQGEHKMKMFFHIAPEVDILETNKTDYVIVQNDPVKAKINFECENQFSLKLINDTVSPSYGVIIDSKTLVNELKFIDKIKVTTKIKWLKK